VTVRATSSWHAGVLSIRAVTNANVDEIVAVFARLGVEAAAVDARMVAVAGHRFRVAVAAHPTPAEAEELTESADLVVADRLSAAARERLDDAGVGWLDVAVTLLSDPLHGWGVNELARHLGRSPGRVSEVLGSLRDQGLVTPSTTPIVPELFWAADEEPRTLPEWEQWVEATRKAVRKEAVTAERGAGMSDETATLHLTHARCRPRHNAHVGTALRTSTSP